MGAQEIENQRILVFTYGTLKRGFPNHILLQEMFATGDAAFVGVYLTADKISLVCGPYKVPFLLNFPGSGDRVVGELYAVSNRALARMDELEGTNRCHYERLPVKLRSANGDDEREGKEEVAAEAYYGHRNYAAEMWKRNGEKGFSNYTVKEAKGKLMAMDITQFLLSAQSANATERTEAEGKLRQFQEQNLPSFLLSLSVELSNDSKPTESRRLAGIVLKNSLDAKDATRKEHLTKQWVVTDISVKSQIKGLLLSTLGSSVHEARHTASQVIAKIASIEIPQKAWPELIGSLLVNMTQLDRPASLKHATLETLGYVCEEISHNDLEQDEVNSVLTAVVQGMNFTEQNSEVRLAATRALYNALDFAQTDFENEMEQNFIMKVVCETAMAKEAHIRQAAFECLISIASTYYEVLEPYMQTIFELTANAVKGDEEGSALKAIEFWSSI